MHHLRLELLSILMFNINIQNKMLMGPQLKQFDTICHLFTGHQRVQPIA